MYSKTIKFSLMYLHFYFLEFLDTFFVSQLVIQCIYRIRGNYDRKILLSIKVATLVLIFWAFRFYSRRRGNGIREVNIGNLCIIQLKGT